MANHGFVTVRRKLTPEMVDRDLREITRRRFLDRVEIDYHRIEKPKKEGMLAAWLITPKGVPAPAYVFDFQMWLSTPRKLEFRHPTGGGQWSWWAQVCVLEEEFAYLYGGTVSDEGIEERWKGSIESVKKYPTWRSWIEGLYAPGPFRNTPGRIAAGRMMIKEETKWLPEGLRKLDLEIAERAADGSLWPIPAAHERKVHA